MLRWLDTLLNSNILKTAALLIMSLDEIVLDRVASWWPLLGGGASQR